MATSPDDQHFVAASFGPVVGQDVDPGEILGRFYGAYTRHEILLGAVDHILLPRSVGLQNTRDYDGLRRLNQKNLHKQSSASVEYRDWHDEPKDAGDWHD